ncbi:16S rRNA (cytidine(1402)-2'-O)-methyltransferase [Thalassotalea litorea]|uniref:Ribosomal RNA small subunit methyltransferase I n=1 Tax=Thalassotalea litorea TaxID=2020715 RepID=A0A5R9IME0_9GAMM|nr:16S rRNA (cytidine(1402)-2'-O)-methyltransferase [Thalassotalea litorea]TLU66710.1 16S rRNA (cytidine(1402)-2'-O)-methyltransferase [Thalassotalea litorea]
MNQQIVQPGTLYVVATPIGNLLDMTQRAIAVLSQVDVIACEDTRHSGRLLQHFSISNRTISLHDHNERQRQEQISEWLKAGKSVALISDAGTPLISDPGFHLVRHCRSESLNVVPVPGACAAIAALSVAGLPTDRFTFEGFLPSKQGARMSTLESLKDETRTMVFYDAPRRIVDTVADIVNTLGTDRYVVIAREITKTFETIYGDTASELLRWLQTDANQEKGELVLMIEGKKASSDEIPPLARKTLALLLKEMKPKKACAVTAEVFGLKKNDLYALTLEDKNN